MSDLRDRHGWALVLLAVACSFAFQSLAPNTGLARAAATVLACGTLILTVWVAQGRRVVARAALIFALALGLTTLVAAAFTEIPIGVEWLANGLLVGLAPVIIAGGLYRSQRARGRVMLSDVSGVLSIYILIGLFFSFLFGAIERVSGEFFAEHITNPQLPTFVYFSFTTLTTTGYGDLAAGTDLGRTLAMGEALIGQVYLVTVVALIVSNLRPRREPVGP